MKAVYFEKHGGAEVLKYGDVPDPIPGKEEVLVDVKACSLNHLDIWTRKGMPGVSVPLPHILGCDAAGVVNKTGPGVRGFTKGDRVIVSPGMGCGRCEHCRSGWDSLCDSYSVLGFQLNGGYAEKVAVPARRLVKIEGTLSFEEWAAVPLVFMTAWHMLHTHAKIKKGETVLVHAAGSGVGSAAIQIAKLAGCSVITTVGSDAKIPKARALGAGEVINYRRKDFSQEVRALTRNRGADVVFEHIGPDTWMKDMACLAKAGRLVTCGATSGPKVEIDLRFLFTRQQTIIGSYMGGHGELAEVLKLVEKGKLKPVVGEVLPLRDAARAHETMESRNHFGKLVLRTTG